MMSPSFLVFSVVFLTAINAHPTPGSGAHENHVEHGSGLLGRWYHDPDHHSMHLFKRQATAYPPTGATPDPTQMPQAWIQALANLEAQNLIPNIPQTVNGAYPKGVDGTSPAVCNSVFECAAPGDIWNAPDGMLGVSFDDGPTPFSPPLYDFLKSQNQTATHFFIGTNIKNNPTIFTQAFNNGDEIACHTWSHPAMTTLTNAQIVAELGWTQQIISDMTGGKVPKFWRPPTGDSDNRVRAIASQMFGLIQVDWNQDTDDWTVGLGKITQAGIESAIAGFLNMPKSPGLIILEHELYNATVQAFIDSYPLMKSKGWDTRSIGNLFGEASFQASILPNSTAGTAGQPGQPGQGGAGGQPGQAGQPGQPGQAGSAAAVATTTATSATSKATTSSASKSAGRARYDVAGLLFKCLIAAPIIALAHTITLA